MPAPIPDDHYAAALTNRHAAAQRNGRVPVPPGQREKDPLTMGGPSEIPTGRMLSKMRARGRLTAPSPALFQALGLFRLNPYQIANGAWKVPPVRKTPNRTLRETPNRTGAAYAAALNQRYETALRKGQVPVLPGKYVTEPVELDGVALDVPIGQYISDLRKEGRTAPVPADLTAALGRYGEVPFQDANKWRLGPAGKRTKWPDAVYAAALNQRYETAQQKRQVPTLPGKEATEHMVLDGIAVDVPTGRLVGHFKYEGRDTAPSAELTAALSRYRVAFTQDADKRWWLLPLNEAASALAVAGNAVVSMSALSAMPMTAAGAAQAQYSRPSAVTDYDPSTYAQQPGGVQQFDPMPFDHMEFDPVLPGDMQPFAPTQQRDYTQSAYVPQFAPTQSAYTPQPGDMQSAYMQQPGDMQSAYM
ncbi:hypothetical protein ABT030_51935, partial [Streptomyces mirabilis]|uniref:hypothetical protein n=1 Tax=Streptomyces mirabilis TaxID=68239 RepID=UPI003323E0CB